MSREHKLKTWPEPFAAIKRGEKTHEIRHDDRGFAVGDVLVLMEWDPTPEKYRSHTGYTDAGPVRARVTYITPGGKWGLPADLCVMSIVLLTEPAR